MSDPLTLASRVASDLKSLVEKGFVSEEVLEATLGALPVQGKAKWAWEDQDDDELSFPVDSVILVLKREGEWWTGQTDDGSTGLFPHNYLTLLPYPPLPSTSSAPPLPSRKPSHLSSQPPAYPSSSSSSSSNPPEKSLHSLPPAPSNLNRPSPRAQTLPPPPARGTSYASSQGTTEDGEAEGATTDYRTRPLAAAYKPSTIDRAKERGGELRGKLPFGGSSKPTAPEEKRGMAKWGAMAGDGASKGAGWAKDGAGSVKKKIF
ncbi:SH3 domain-containing protein [Mrakia frigida]|uniref:SH3 domain-containing protein n=1 Tax=Mrakia frigida TaxID=29902 RepID=UPI003FCBF7C6